MDEIQELRQLTISGVTYQIIPIDYSAITITDISGNTWEVMGKQYEEKTVFDPGAIDFSGGTKPNPGKISGDTVGGETIKPVDGETLP